MSRLTLSVTVYFDATRVGAGKNLRCSMVTKKGVTGLYGKDGYGVERTISRGTKGKVSESQG
jgi:hypothetical protein